MTLTPEQKKRIANYTGGMWPKERLIRAKDFMRRNGITDEEDQREVAKIAMVSMEEMG